MQRRVLTGEVVDAAVTSFERTLRLMTLPPLLSAGAIVSQGPALWIGALFAQLVFMGSVVALFPAVEPVSRRLGHWGAVRFALGLMAEDYPETTRLRLTSALVAASVGVLAIVAVST